MSHAHITLEAPRVSLRETADIAYLKMNPGNSDNLVSLSDFVQSYSDNYAHCFIDISGVDDIVNTDSRALALYTMMGKVMQDSDIKIGFVLNQTQSRLFKTLRLDEVFPIFSDYDACLDSIIELPEETEDFDYGGGFTTLDYNRDGQRISRRASINSPPRLYARNTRMSPVPGRPDSRTYVQCSGLLSPRDLEEPEEAFPEPEPAQSSSDTVAIRTYKSEPMYLEHMFPGHIEEELRKVRRSASVQDDSARTPFDSFTLAELVAIGEETLP